MTETEDTNSNKKLIDKLLDSKAKNERLYRLGIGGDGYEPTELDSSLVNGELEPTILIRQVISQTCICPHCSKQWNYTPRNGSLKDKFFTTCPRCHGGIRLKSLYKRIPNSKSGGTESNA